MFPKIWWILRTLIYKPFFGRIGFPSYLGKPILLLGTKKIFIGKFVRIFPHLRIETHGKDAMIEIQDDVSIGQNVHITASSKLVIGKSTTILANVFITDIDHDYEEIGKHILKQKYIVKETIIGENCFIGIGASIQAGTILGRQCIVGTHAVVRGVFPDYCVIVGMPAKIIKKYNLKTDKWEKVDSHE